MRNPDTYGIDKMSTLEMLEIINSENTKVTLAVEAALPQIVPFLEQLLPLAVHALVEGAEV